MDTKRIVIPIGAIVILVLMALTALAVIFVVLLAPASGTEEQPNTTSVAAPDNFEIIPTDTYAIVIKFSKKKSAPGGFVNIEYGQIPESIVFTSRDFSQKFTFQLKR